MKVQPASKIFRTATGIKSKPKDMKESRLVMTCLTILGVTGRLFNFRIVLGGEAGSEILDLSRLVLSENFLQTTLLYLM